jgi:hypothetical protein
MDVVFTLLFHGIHLLKMNAEYKLQYISNDMYTLEILHYLENYDRLALAPDQQVSGGISLALKAAGPLTSV